MRGPIAGLFALSLVSVGCAPEGEDDGPEGFTMYDASPAPIVGGDTGIGLGSDSAVVGTPPVNSGAVGAVDTGVIAPLKDSGVGTPPADTGVANDATTPPADTGTPVTVDGPEPKIPKPSGACPAFKSGSTTINGLQVEVQAGPKGAGKGPLLFYWHGTGGTGNEPFGSAGRPGTLPDAVKKEILDMGGLIIAPTTTTMMGSDVTFVLGVWFTPGDLNWADFVAGCAVQDYNIDPRRIYSTGCSAGGLMTGSMAFQRSNYLAAAAPNSGGIAVPGQDAPQDPKRVAPTMTMHGKKGDDVVIVDFADTSATFATSAKGKGFVIDCDHGGGHCRTPPELQVAAWQFMKDHPFGVSPEPYANGIPASFPKYCVIK